LPGADIVVFRAADGTNAEHHVLVDRAGVVRVWKRWLRRGTLLVQGEVSASGALVLRQRGGTAERQLVFRRRRDAN